MKNMQESVVASKGQEQKTNSSIPGNSYGFCVEVAPLVGYPAVRMANTDVSLVLKDPICQVDALLKLDKIIESDMLMTLMDLSVEAEGLGASIRYSDTESPSVTRHPVEDLEEPSDLPWDVWLEKSRALVFIQAVEHLKTTGKPVCAFVTAPLTLAGLLLGAENLMIEAGTENEFMSDFLYQCVTVTRQYVNALENAGAAAICLLDPTAMMLGPTLYRKYAGAFTQTVIAGMTVPAILHICGDTSMILGQMAETGAMVLSIDSAVPLTMAAENVPADVILMGNLDPVFCVSNDVETVAQATRQMNESMRDRPAFISSTGCDLPIDTPIENLSAFIQAGR